MPHADIDAALRRIGIWTVRQIGPGDIKTALELHEAGTLAAEEGDRLGRDLTDWAAVTGA